MNEILFVVDEDLEGGFAARALNASIFTQAETIEELHRLGTRCRSVSF